jgi:glucose uptake protein GlcU
VERRRAILDGRGNTGRAVFEPKVAQPKPGLYLREMGIVIALIVVGIILLVLGIAVKAAMFLLWIGIILLVVGAVMAVLRQVRNRA